MNQKFDYGELIELYLAVGAEQSREKRLWSGIGPEDLEGTRASFAKIVRLTKLHTKLNSLLKGLET